VEPKHYISAKRILPKDGKEAIRKAKFFDLALLDINLPDMEGAKLLTLM